MRNIASDLGGTTIGRPYGGGSFSVAPSGRIAYTHVTPYRPAELAIVHGRKSRPAILLRESYREGKKVKKRTIANLSSLSIEKAELLRLVLKGKKVAAVDELFEKIESKHHGHIQAVLKVIDKLGLEKIISAKRCRERDIIVSVIVARLCRPDSKLAMTRWWEDTTLPQLLDLDALVVRWRIRRLARGIPAQRVDDERVCERAELALGADHGEDGDTREAGARICT